MTPAAQKQAAHPRVETPGTTEAAGERISVRIGGSCHPDAAGGGPYLLSVPPVKLLEKCEARVLAWSEKLGGGTRAFIKLYTQRPRRIASEGVRTSIRVCREFDRLKSLEQVGVSCTRPLFWGRGESPRRGRVEVLATRQVEGAEPLRQALRERAALVDELDWKQLLAEVAAMHAAGVQHGALSPKNVLIDRERRFYLCDLASSMRYPAPIGDTRMALFDLVHLFEGLGKLLGTERCKPILLEGTEDRDLTERVLKKVAGYRRRQVFQHQRLRAEFHLRNLWAWRGAEDPQLPCYGRSGDEG
jgi:tRNA A-37 threonylcarbamoyl transferase component Bud32